MHLSERLSAPFCTMQSPSTITSCTLHCTNSPLAPPSFALVAPLTAPSGPYRGQGACWACCWRIAGSGMGAVGNGPIMGPHSARAAPRTRDAAPVAGARMCAGCMIGAALQGLGVRGQTRRSQSDYLVTIHLCSWQTPCKHSVGRHLTKGCTVLHRRLYIRVTDIYLCLKFLPKSMQHAEEKTDVCLGWHHGWCAGPGQASRDLLNGPNSVVREGRAVRHCPPTGKPRQRVVDVSAKASHERIVSSYKKSITFQYIPSLKDATPSGRSHAHKGLTEFFEKSMDALPGQALDLTHAPSHGGAPHRARAPAGAS